MTTEDHGADAREDKTISFIIDGETYETSQREWTPNELIRRFAEKDPATFYLVEIHGQKQESYKDSGETAFRIQPHDRFQTICIGPMPVSDGSGLTGVPAFINGLAELGYTPRQLANHPNHVVIDYEVQTGKFAGQQFQLGFLVPADFPLTPPSGPHVSPGPHPINTNAEHPQRAHESEFSQIVSGNWQYWSRPHPSWVKRTVANYMSHVFQLWASQ